MFSKLRLPLLSCALLLVYGSAALAAPSENEGVAQQAAQRVAEPEQAEGLDGQQLFELLVGEFALQQNELGLALGAYRDMALRTRDPQVVRRAMELAGAAKQYDLALDLGRLWQELEPESKLPRQTIAGLLLVTGRLDELAVVVGEALAAEPEKLAENLLSLNPLLARYPDKAAALTFVERVVEPYSASPEAHYAVAVAASDAGQLSLARSEARRAQTLKPEWDAPVVLEAVLLLKGDGESRTEASAEAAARLLSAYLDQHPEAQGVRLHLARMLIGAKKYAEARQQFDFLLKSRPDDIEMIYPVAMLALQEKDLETARTQFSRLLEMPFPDQAGARFFLGEVEELAGNTATALLHYEQVRSGPRYVSARSRMAYLLADQQKLPEAFAVLHQSKVDSEQEKRFLGRVEADLLRQAGQHDALYQFLQAQLKQNPEDTGVLYDLALAAEKLDKVEEMERLLRKLMALEPENAHAMNALGYSLADRNIRLDEAETLIQKASALAPADPYIMDSLGWVFYRQGKLEAARSTLEKAYAIKPEAEIAAHLAEVLWTAGQYEALYQFQHARLKQVPDDVDSLYSLSFAAEKLGKLDEMEQLLRQAIALAPEYPHALNALGYSFADRNIRLEEADALISKAFRLAPDDPYIMDSQGWILYRQGKLEQALTLLQRAYALEPDSEIAAHLGEVLWQMQRRDEALAIWHEALARTPEHPVLKAVMQKFAR